MAQCEYLALQEYVRGTRCQHNRMENVDRCAEHAKRLDDMYESRDQDLREYAKGMQGEQRRADVEGI